LIRKQESVDEEQKKILVIAKKSKKVKVFKFYFPSFYKFSFLSAVPLALLFETMKSLFILHSSVIA
jgi:hypothetical protein